jgi:hypothetical protein
MKIRAEHGIALAVIRGRSREAGGLGRIAPRSHARDPPRTAENREKIMKKPNN